MVLPILHYLYSMAQGQQSMFKFSNGVVPGILFYLCLILDLTIPLFFFFTSTDFLDWTNGVFGASANAIFGVSMFFGILIFTFYAFMIHLSFPEKIPQGINQLALRIFPLIAIFIAEEDILQTVFIYGLIDYASVSLVLATYLLGHMLFVKDKAKAKKVLDFKGIDLAIALVFGLPLAALGIALFVSGFVYRYPDMSLISLLTWTMPFVLIFIAQYQVMRRYTDRFYEQR